MKLSNSKSFSGKKLALLSAAAVLLTATEVVNCAINQTDKMTGLPDCAPLPS